MCAALNGPDSPAGQAVGVGRDEFMELAWSMFCNLQTRGLAAATPVSKVDGYDTSSTSGQSFDATGAGKAAMAAADRGLEANSEKLVGVDGGDVADYEIGAGAAATAFATYAASTARDTAASAL